MAKHEDASGSYGQEFGNVFVILLENDEHREEFFSASDRGHSFAEAGEEKWVKQFEALAEFCFPARLKHGGSEDFKLLSPILILE